MEEHSVKMSRMRKQIAENLRHSCSHNPTVSIFGLFDFTKLLEMKAAYAAKGQKIPDTAIFMKAATICLQEYPALNARLGDGEILTCDSFNPGFAVDTPRGLIVLTLHDAQDKSLPQLADEFRSLLHRLQDGTLTLDDYKGSTFTVSSMSKNAFGSFATSIINNDECVILGFGGIHKGVFADANDQPVVRSACYVTVNFNHAIVDGLIANQFMARLKEILEDPGAYM